ncbi:MAG: thioredoxin family protein [Anaerolineales bacterium]
MKFINQHSYFVFAGTVLVGAALILGAGGMTTSRLLVLLGLAFVLAAVYLIFYPGRGLQDPASRDFMERYGFEYTPTFILFDGDGNERWRKLGALNKAAVQSALMELK